MPQYLPTDTSVGGNSEPAGGKPKYEGVLTPTFYMSQGGVRALNGKGTISVYAERAINRTKVQTAIRYWNTAADAPLFRETQHRDNADVVVRFRHEIAGDTSGLIADAEVHGGQFFVNIPYGIFDATLVAHELGHTTGLADAYNQTYSKGRPVDIPYLAGAATRWSAPYESQYIPGAGAHRIMFGGGAPSQVEAQLALRQVGIDPGVLGLYRYEDTGANKKRAFNSTIGGE